MVKRFDGQHQTSKGLDLTKKTWFAQLGNILARSEARDDLWQPLEEVLLGADVGITTTNRLLNLLQEETSRHTQWSTSTIQAALKRELLASLNQAQANSFLVETESLVEKPTVILMVGVNGVGKTTSIAKLAYLAGAQGKKVVLAAGDTFRAAATEQLKILGDEASATIIANQSGADPGAVTYDAYQAAKSRAADLLIIDTAGRLHTKTNLMEELKKIRRVLSQLAPSNPHKVILVIDASTGQNGLVQAKSFVDAIQVDGIFLTKLDGTAKGGIIFPICQELSLPILYIGTGEHLTDIAPFVPEEYVDTLFASG